MSVNWPCVVISTQGQFLQPFWTIYATNHPAPSRHCCRQYLTVIVTKEIIEYANSSCVLVKYGPFYITLKFDKKKNWVYIWYRNISVQPLWYYASVLIPEDPFTILIAHYLMAINLYPSTLCSLGTMPTVWKIAMLNIVIWHVSWTVLL